MISSTVIRVPVHSHRLLPRRSCHLSCGRCLRYQGENDMHTYFGNSARGSGYACLMEKLVHSWRAQWSAEPGTTSPNA
eukprot:COSAG01_NODE_6790_length_3496_cov_3.344127_3_plen_78_part_00